MPNCSHEEADTRIFLHASYIANTCENSIIVKSPDTDVLVIGIALDSIIGSSRLYFDTGRDEHVPPNKDSLLEHIQRANFQSAIYKRSLQQRPDIPSPVDYGWKLHDNELEIDGMNMQPAQESILELSTCTCKKSKCEVGHASNNCCVFWGIPCTELCTCKNCCNINYCDDEEDEHTDLDEDEEL